MPSELGRLTSLASLVLGSNRLSGTIPTELGLCTNLHMLSFPSNSISGTLPAALMHSGLLVLSVGSNRLSGTLPALENATALRSFALHQNRISGTLSVNLGDSFSQLLGRVQLHTNQLSGFIPAQLITAIAAANGTLPALHANRLSGTLPTELALVSQLSFPALGYNSLSGTIPEALTIGARAWTKSMAGRMDLFSNRIGYPHWRQAHGHPSPEETIIARRTTPWYDDWAECRGRAGSLTSGREHCYGTGR